MLGLLLTFIHPCPRALLPSPSLTLTFPSLSVLQGLAKAGSLRLPPGCPAQGLPPRGRRSVPASRGRGQVPSVVLSIFLFPGLLPSEMQRPLSAEPLRLYRSLQTTFEMTGGTGVASQFSRQLGEKLPLPGRVCSPVSSQNVHERGLPSPGWTHDGHKLPTVEFPRDSFKEGLVSCKKQITFIFQLSRDFFLLPLVRYKHKYI